MRRRSGDELARMRRAGRVVAEMHEATRAVARPGATTADLDRAAREVLERRRARSNFLGYHGFPAVICASVNDMVVHGIPGDERLEEGDLVSIDCGAIVEGYHGDAAFTMLVGDGAWEAAPPETRRLVEVTEAALWAGIAEMHDGRRLHDIGRAVEEVVGKAGMSLAEGYGGHAIGTDMHEDPRVPNYWPGRPGPKLRVGNVLAVEPMVNLGGPETEVLADGWSVVTSDGSLSAHFEHTVAVTEDGCEVLTRAEPR
ncbi:MAG: type I methionyl aminopeptidase [Acidimicrobiales bacterium]